LREASKEKLLEVGLELKVLRMDSNEHNMVHWEMVVDAPEESLVMNPPLPTERTEYIWRVC
jgi:hypothetical protein